MSFAHALRALSRVAPDRPRVAAGRPRASSRSRRVAFRAKASEKTRDTPFEDDDDLTYADLAEEEARLISANAKKRAKKKAAKSNGQSNAEQVRADKIKNAFAPKPPGNTRPPAKQPPVKQRHDFIKLPAALVGCCPRSNAATDNQRLCFAFNLGTCSAVAPGQTCARGAHLCMKRTASGEACSQLHGALKCTA